MGIVLFIALNKWQKCGLVPVNFTHILQGPLIGKLDSVPGQWKHPVRFGEVIGTKGTDTINTTNTGNRIKGISMG